MHWKRHDGRVLGAQMVPLYHQHGTLNVFVVTGGFIFHHIYILFRVLHRWRCTLSIPIGRCDYLLLSLVNTIGATDRLLVSSPLYLNLWYMYHGVWTWIERTGNKQFLKGVRTPKCLCCTYKM